MDCATKRVTLKTANGSKIVMVGKLQDCLSNVISTMVVEKLIKKGCKAYLAYVRDASVIGSIVDSIQKVNEFSTAPYRIQC